MNLIYAVSSNGVIGDAGKMPWPKLKEDLKRFKQLTLGHVVIMGRKTWDSLGGKPLSERVNIVLTRRHGTGTQEGRGAPVILGDGARYVPSFQAAREEAAWAARQGKQVWVIGGAEIYKLAAPYATRCEVTEIDAEWEGDTVLPPGLPSHVPVGPRGWDRMQKVAHSGFSFVTYGRES